MSNQNQTEDKSKQTMSRRKFLTNSGYAVGGVVLGGVLGSLLPRPAKQAAPQTPQTQTNAGKSYNEALMFFNQEQFSITQAATDRIFPADEQGPGAKDLGVAFYIDHQLAGDWGFNARDYMQPPFFVGEQTQGYQGHLKRREIFYIGLREIQNYSHNKYNKGFTSLTPEEQDAVLAAFEKDEVNLTTISASGFFKLLRSSTLEGVYSDPLYGGNKNMQGWVMRGYPGDQMAFTDIIEKEYTVLPPRSLKDHM
ncbi:gluconate 2-dehydrogenase subunit 3 family protein [Paenibacillus sp. IITD108]|uniref:gluconate 2-dehydrogenase subunit 3 family protein n=1 Tax=Paenibacillus sp. IITD108 TaxID=3116649 RepID=UPI003FA7CF53